MRTWRMLFVFLLAVLTGELGSAQTPAVLPLPERARVVNQWLEKRLDTVLLPLMRRAEIDLWLVICREYNEDPVYPTLVPAPSFAARRTTMLLFVDGGEQGLEKVAVSRYPIGRLYRSVWDPAKTDQWSCLAETVRKYNPKRIGINQSENFAHADGLSATLKEKLVKALGPELSSRLVSAEAVAVGWLETRIQEELEVYPHMVAIAHEIIAEAFSERVITPGVTSTEEVEWWFRQRFEELDLDTWFQPSVEIQRREGLFPEDKDRRIIHRGDLLHCDVGITYLRLNTDTQEHAYVLQDGETDVPPGLKKALQVGNRLQDILIAAFKTGRTGNDVLKLALAQARQEGIQASIYSHPLGYHGHAAGPTIGLWDHQEGVPGPGDYPLYPNTCYSIELNVVVPVPEWGNQKVRIALEQDAVFTGDSVRFIDGRQTEFHLVH